MKSTFYLFMIAFFLMIAVACNNNSTNKPTAYAEIAKNEPTQSDTAVKALPSSNSEVIPNKTNPKPALSTVYIYNFHVTNRCPSCIAIEEATTKALNSYFSAELKAGRIKRQIVNVDDEKNKAISEKYEAFGSGLIIVKSLNGKETKTDLTGDGFKFAKNKEDRFIEILKSKIQELLK